MRKLNWLWVAALAALASVGCDGDAPRVAELPYAEGPYTVEIIKDDFIVDGQGAVRESVTFDTWDEAQDRLDQLFNQGAYAPQFGQAEQAQSWTKTPENHDHHWAVQPNQAGWPTPAKNALQDFVVELNSMMPFMQFTHLQRSPQNGKNFRTNDANFILVKNQNQGAWPYNTHCNQFEAGETIVVSSGNRVISSWIFLCRGQIEATANQRLAECINLGGCSGISQSIAQRWFYEYIMLHEFGHTLGAPDYTSGAACSNPIGTGTECMPGQKWGGLDTVMSYCVGDSISNLVNLVVQDPSDGLYPFDYCETNYLQNSTPHLAEDGVPASYLWDGVTNVVPTY
jgi:hypothetical protein